MYLRECIKLIVINARNTTNAPYVDTLAEYFSDLDSFKSYLAS